MARPDTQLVGIWDCARAPLFLGGLLIFYTELQTICEFEPCRFGGMYFVDAAAASLSSHPFLSVLLFLRDGGQSWNVASMPEKKRKEKFWPEPGSPDYQYGSTLQLQHLHERYGRLRPLRMTPDALSQAATYLSEKARTSLPCVIHLKNNPRQPGFSNANFDGWFEFLTSMGKEGRFHFFLIGNEPVDPRIQKLSNVTVTVADGLTLPQQLALVQVSYLFMGMASGPAQMAVLSDVPYVIFKNPTHHAAEMENELKGKPRLSFAYPLQKIVRELETADVLEREFREISAVHSADRWRARTAPSLVTYGK